MKLVPADLNADINSFASARDAELVGGSTAPRNERQSDAAAPPAPIRDDEDDAAAGPAVAETSLTNNILDDVLDTAMDAITSDVTEMISNVIASNVIRTSGGLELNDPEGG